MDQEKNLSEKRPSMIRTMRTDAELYAKEKKLSALQISASAYASRPPPPAPVNDKKFSPKILVGGIIFLCVIILGGGTWWLLSSKSNNTQIKEIPPPPAIIAAEGQNILTLKQANAAILFNTLSAEYIKTFRSGILTYYPIKIYLGDHSVAYINIKNFVQLLSWHPPDALLETLVPDFNLFIFANKPSNDFAVIIQTVDFERAFSSMLEWERTLARDWQNILNNKNPIVAFPGAFQDEIIKNQDARILKKDDGSVVIGYVIFNKKYIVISTSREALGEILNRLIALPPRQ